MSIYALLGSRDPLDLIDHWDNRPAAFFASAALALATICTNISANSFSAANDLTALFPRVGSLSAKIYPSAIAYPFRSILTSRAVKSSARSLAVGYYAHGRSFPRQSAS